MVKLLKIKNVDGAEAFVNIVADIYEQESIVITDRLLIVHDISDENELIYCFLSDYHVNLLIDTLTKYEIEVLFSMDFTNQLIDIINECKINEFVNQFEDFFDTETIIGEFYINNINVDMVLDKMIKYGRESLTETDYLILHS